MSDSQSVPPPPTAGSLADARIMAIVCYALFIVAVANGLTAIVGVVLAYIKRDDARGTIWESHFRNLIQLFWSSVAVFALFLIVIVVAVFDVVHLAQADAFPGVVFLIPALWILGIAYAVWYLYRTVKGILLAFDNKAYA